MKKESYRATATLKLLILQILISLLGINLGFIWEVYDENVKWENLFYPGVKVSGIDLSGHYKEEGKGNIKSGYIDSLLNRKLTIVALDKKYTVDLAKVIKNNDLDEVIDEAYQFGKSLSAYNKFKLIKKGSSKDYTISYNYDDEYIKMFVQSIEKEINIEPVNAKISKPFNESIQVISHDNGQQLEAEKLEEMIKASINSYDYKDISIEAPIKHFDAAITAEKLTSINTRISDFKTSFAASSNNRANNIELATRLINGTLLMPNEVFSFNQSVGERTRERGFREAPVIIGNKFDSGLGGGICQVSSTLYNAVLKSGIKDIKRVHHSIPSSYVGLGLDATVDWNNIDFSFKNTFKFPIYIEAYIENKNLFINFYSDSSLMNKRYEIINDVYQVLEAKNEGIKNNNFIKEQTALLQNGHNGYKVKVIRNTYEGDKIVASEVISDDYYVERN